MDLEKNLWPCTINMYNKRRNSKINKIWPLKYMAIKYSFMIYSYFFYLQVCQSVYSNTEILHDGHTPIYEEIP